MHCVVLKDNEGKPTGIMCGGRRQARRLCKACGRDFATILCDFPVGKNKTCSAPLCRKCTTSVGPDRDYCPNHKDATPAAEQTSLF